MFLFATLNFFVCMSHFFYYSYNVNPQERAKRLEEKMHAQFNKMHDFLRKKEEEMVRQLQRQASSAEVSMKQNASFFFKVANKRKQPGVHIGVRTTDKPT